MVGTEVFSVDGDGPDSHAQLPYRLIHAEKPALLTGTIQNGHELRPQSLETDPGAVEALLDARPHAEPSGRVHHQGGAMGRPR